MTPGGKRNLIILGSQVPQYLTYLPLLQLADKDFGAGVATDISV